MKFACFAGDSGPQLGQVDDAQGIIRPVTVAKDMVDLIRRYDEIKPGLSGGWRRAATVLGQAARPHPTSSTQHLLRRQELPRPCQGIRRERLSKREP